MTQHAARHTISVAGKVRARWLMRWVLRRHVAGDGDAAAGGGGRDECEQAPAAG